MHIAPLRIKVPPPPKKEKQSKIKAINEKKTKTPAINKKFMSTAFIHIFTVSGLLQKSYPFNVFRGNSRRTWMCTAIKINQHICWYANNNCCPTKHRPRGEVLYKKLICENYLKVPHQSFLKFRYLNWCRELFILYSVLRFWFFKFLSSDICM